MGEGGGRGWVSQIISWYKHSLYRSDGAFFGGSDPLLHGAHVSGQGRLVPYS